MAECRIKCGAQQSCATGERGGLSGSLGGSRDDCAAIVGRGFFISTHLEINFKKRELVVEWWDD